MNNWITPILTFVLVVVTAYYAWQTRKTVQAMEESNEASNRPVISISIRDRPESISLMDLVVTNAGKGLARDVKFTVKGDNFRLVEVGSIKENIRDFRPIKNGIKVLAPGETRSYWFMSAIGRVEELQSIKTKLDIKYNNHDKTRSYLDTFNLDFLSLPQYSLGDDPMYKVSKESEKIRKELESIRKVLEK